MEMTVRDHTQPCEHVDRMIPTYRDAFGIDYLPEALVSCPWSVLCPGGKKITVRKLNEKLWEVVDE